MSEQEPEAFEAWVARCPLCQSIVAVDFCGGAPLLACYNHDEPWHGHAKLPDDFYDEVISISAGDGSGTGSNTRLYIFPSEGSGGDA